jgi:hypothetical protein
MTVKKTIAVAQIIPQYRENEGHGRRRLLTPDEVYRLPNNEMLIIVRGEKVLLANKFDYTGHPYAKLMVKSNVHDYFLEKITPFPQTETENRTQHAGKIAQCSDLTQNPSQSKKSGGQRKSNQFSNKQTHPPDYSHLMGTFNQQPPNTSKQSLVKPSSEEIPQGQENETDGNMYVENNMGALLVEDYSLHHSNSICELSGCTDPPDY